MDSRLGELAALAASVFFTVTALCFESAARRIGSLSLNILRLFVALVLFTALGILVRGEAVPVSAGTSVWLWLSLSGLVGFVFGDLFLFQAYVDIGARPSQVLFASAPLLTALIGFFALGERVGPAGLAGMALVIAGIAAVVADGGPKGSGPADAVRGRAHAALKLRGALFAFLGALGQAGGFILAKIGAPESDPFAATQIRALAGIAGFLAVAAARGRLAETAAALKDRRALGLLSVGSFFGPFLGVSLGLFAAQRANAGIAATLIGLPPVLILLPSVVFKKERVRWPEVAGAVLAVGGTALLFRS